MWRSGGRLRRWSLNVGVRVRVAMIWRVRNGDGGQFKGRHLPLLGLCVRGNTAVVIIIGYGALLDGVCAAFRVRIRSRVA